MIENKIINKSFDCERALYNLNNCIVEDCIFAGPADGESVLKESRNIKVLNSSFSLRYPLWHVNTFSVVNSEMDSLTRAALWYSSNGEISNSKLSGIKAVRECENIVLNECEINSEEFGWKSKNISLCNSEIVSEYLFLDSSDVKLSNVRMTGKYSFQYINNLEIIDSYLDTKDAFWHSNDVVVKNSTIKSEYLGWYSKNLTLINCKIIGTQPLCYCENLVLVDCTMENCDLSFEYSDVDADIIGHIDSVKNIKSGMVKADSIGEIINEDQVIECFGKVHIKSDSDGNKLFY